MNTFDVFFGHTFMWGNTNFTAANKYSGFFGLFELVLCMCALTNKKERDRVSNENKVLSLLAAIFGLSLVSPPPPALSPNDSTQSAN